MTDITIEVRNTEKDDLFTTVRGVVRNNVPRTCKSLSLIAIFRDQNGDTVDKVTEQVVYDIDRSSYLERGEARTFSIMSSSPYVDSVEMKYSASFQKNSGFVKR